MNFHLPPVAVVAAHVEVGQDDAALRVVGGPVALGHRRPPGQGGAHGWGEWAREEWGMGRDGEGRSWGN